ncbi:MAG: right-handed parallel beta-helix repeat-containing protein, partial [Chloroflexi bacterium]|nr:right-handed parallel beta-helix repeat-containing protein [Chloroflexota bacterium]
MVRVLVVLVVIAAVCASPKPAPAQADVITVRDSCTLVDAIMAANADIPVGGCPAGDGSDVIELTADVVLTAIVEEDWANSRALGLPAITSTITLEGNGYTIRRSDQSGTPDFLLIYVRETGDLTLNDVNLSGSSTPVVPTLHDSAIINEGRLTLTDSTVTHNDTTALLNSGTATITGSKLSNNDGYGLANFGPADITDTLVSGNSWAGILNYSSLGPLTLSASAIRSNGGGVGGGIITYGDNVTLSDCSIEDNTGSGIHNEGTITITNCDIVRNLAGSGGGVYNNRGTVTLV